MSRVDQTVLILLFLFALFAYFIPSIVAASRTHKNQNAILILNLLLGWTFLGWVAALVWSCSSNIDRGGRAAPGEKLCPQCAEAVKAAALKCKHCGADLSVPTVQQAS